MDTEFEAKTDDLVASNLEHHHQIREDDHGHVHTEGGADDHASADLIEGDRSDNSIEAGVGGDEVDGKQGNDTLDGGRGDDVLYGGFGEDTLTGGKGKDVFILSPDKDVITDFKVGEDAIGLVYALDLTFTQKGSDLIIRGDDGVNTLLKGVEKDDFLANYPNNLQIVPAISIDIL